MNRIDRLFGILVLLQSKKYVTAEYICQKFDIGARTVYRDIKALNEQGVPVSFEQNRGYFIVQGYFLPPVSFNPDEANAILLMEGLVSTMADRSIQQHYSSALDKIKNVLRSQQKEQLEQLKQQTHVQMPARFVKDYNYLSQIQTAISARHILDISYRNAKEEDSRRRVEPIGLIFYAFDWHLIGWCHIRQDYRDFKVSRIVSINDAQQPFTIQEHIPLADYMKQLPVDW
ncbi:MAG: YafY family transcriptional regulator [Chitinophagales bacterium]|nr:YafY family transcriptional regulator [Chitinophagales bacterium]